MQSEVASSMIRRKRDGIRETFLNP